ncbi:MAG: ABC transporter substrate-binding protein [Thermodesulfovibrionales bacterium]
MRTVRSGFRISVVLLAALFSLALIAPAAAEKSIGVIMTGNLSYFKEMHKAFTEALAAEGFGKVEIVVQTPAPDTMSWTNAARKLVAVGSDLIVSYGAPATLAVMDETGDIPLVYAGVFDPIGVGVKGKNATGVSSKVPIAGLLKNFKAIAPFSNLGVVYSDSEKDTVLQANEVAHLEGSFGFKSTKFSVRRAADAAKIANVDALFLTTACSGMQCVANIVGIANKLKVPTATTMGGGEQSGIILTITANPAEQGREAAKIVANVLKGAKPSTIPPVQPKKIDLIVNLKAANEMGLKIPMDVLGSASKVIR